MSVLTAKRLVQASLVTPEGVLLSSRDHKRAVRREELRDRAVEDLATKIVGHVVGQRTRYGRSLGLIIRAEKLGTGELLHAQTRALLADTLQSRASTGYASTSAPRHDDPTSLVSFPRQRSYSTDDASVSGSSLRSEAVRSEPFRSESIRSESIRSESFRSEPVSASRRGGQAAGLARRRDATTATIVATYLDRRMGVAGAQRDAADVHIVQTGGGKGVTVYRGMVSSGQDLTFRSVRCDGQPFGLTVGGPLDIWMSVCIYSSIFDKYLDMTRLLSNTSFSDF